MKAATSRFLRLALNGGTNPSSDTGAPAGGQFLESSPQVIDVGVKREAHTAAQFGAVGESIGRRLKLCQVWVESFEDGSRWLRRSQ